MVCRKHSRRSMHIRTPKETVHKAGQKMSAIAIVPNVPLAAKTKSLKMRFIKVSASC